MFNPEGVFKACIVTVLICCSLSSNAQHLLSRNTSIDVTNQRIEDVLHILSNQGNFYFSYNSNIIRSDSLVSITMKDKTLREVLQTLFAQANPFRVQPVFNFLMYFIDKILNGDIVLPEKLFVFDLGNQQQTLNDSF